MRVKKKEQRMVSRLARKRAQVLAQRLGWVTAEMKAPVMALMMVL